MIGRSIGIPSKDWRALGTDQQWLLGGMLRQASMNRNVAFPLLGLHVPHQLYYDLATTFCVRLLMVREQRLGMSAC